MQAPRAVDRIQSPEQAANRCDEKHPHCTNCLKRQTTCEYFELSFRLKGGVEARAIRPRSPRTASHAPSPTSNVALSAHTIFSGRIQTPTGRLLERQLFHHYLEMTTRSKGTHFDWAFWTVQQAGQSQCVMDALLGVAAFHLRLFHDNDALGRASYEYMVCAINAHRQELDVGLNKHNASSIAAACTLISIHAAISQNHLGVKDSSQTPHSWFLPLQRGLELIRLTTPLIQIPSNDPEHLGIETTTQIFQQARHSNPFSFLLLYSADPHASQDDVSAYTAAVAHLSYIYADIQHRRPLHFAVMVSTRFVDLVASNDPRALAITGPGGQ
ncbi:hypothetical protein FDECE_308 [Fusarium decemcellulare]|nr:hypothetical protein FDECE_308 [Fusarium decemcellulare]